MPTSGPASSTDSAGAGRSGAADATPQRTIIPRELNTQIARSSGVGRLLEPCRAMTAPTSALERIIRRGSGRSQESGPRCELCSVPVAAEHRHLLDTEAAVVLCACQACSLLFSRDAASEGHYRLVPQRRTRLAAVPTKDLGVPVGLAFFVLRPDGVV